MTSLVFITLFAILTVAVSLGCLFMIWKTKGEDLSYGFMFSWSLMLDVIIVMVAVKEWQEYLQ